MSKEIQNIKVGIGVMILRNDKILMGRRKGSHGAGEYAFTGGHLEYMESFSECAERETLEESGIKIKNIRFLCLANENTYPPRHGVLIGVIADWESGEPQVLEPDKRESWDWYDLDNLPEPIFIPAKIMIDSYKTKRNYYDKE
jgi:8-oxo-dGTP diphosphatase